VTQNQYLWSQLSGNIANAVITGIQNALNEDLPLILYWTTLSIASAQDVDGTLNYVGCLTGFPRPLVSDIFFESNVITFTDANIPQPSYTLTDLTFLAGDSSVNTAGGNFINAGFAAGQYIIIQGSNSNNYTTKVKSVTASKMVLLTYPVVAESDANSITITIGNMTIGFDDANFPTPLNPPYVFNSIAGEFDNALPLSSNVMPASWYQSMLPVFAIAKYYGPSLYTVDQVAAWANTQGGGTGYQITRDAYNNIVVTFTTLIDERALLIFNMIWAALETLPLVTGQQP